MDGEANPASPVPSGTRSLVAPEFLAVLDAIPAIAISSDNLLQARSAVAQLSALPMTDDLRDVSVKERFIPGPLQGEKLRVVLYRANSSGAQTGPAFLHIHGGGFVLGTPEMEQNLARTLAVDLGCLVVSVDYRLAPEAPYPGAVEDCFAALEWLHAAAGELGIDPKRIAIGGTSAGGGHAAALAIHARDRGGAPICFQMLDQPMLDDRTGAGADAHPYCGEFGHTAPSNKFGWRALLGCEPGGPDVLEKAVPARVSDLTGLPPAFISVGGLDLFMEEAIDYARRLSRAGVAAELHVFPGGFHGFEMAKEAPQVKALRALRRDAILRGFAQSQ